MEDLDIWKLITTIRWRNDLKLSWHLKEKGLGRQKNRRKSVSLFYFIFLSPSAHLCHQCCSLLVFLFHLYFFFFNFWGIQPSFLPVSLVMKTSLHWLHTSSFLLTTAASVGHCLSQRCQASVHKPSPNFLVSTQTNFSPTWQEFLTKKRCQDVASVILFTCKDICYHHYHKLKVTGTYMLK